MEQTADRPEILYLFDPLCGWCYGMSPVIRQAQQAFAGRIDVSVLCGGMLTGADAASIGESWDFLSGGAAQVGEVTGAEFGAAYHTVGEEGALRLDSEPPSRAIVVFRQLDGGQQRTIQFAHDVQTALFRDGQDLNELATYLPLLQPYGVDAAAFQRLWSAPETAALVQQEFTTVGRLNLEGLPTTVLRVGNDGYIVAKGYQPYTVFAAGLEQALAEKAGG
ncbi:DsbA family protein [Hymenobacter aerilatus]|uniref:DsbA family protein n=1 Tax=Hymenobacter aerilatus TaxID=2932251 RepID=A0A8T9SW20_9BACT|nr:DsbA family protein [Hymenobacter aerilatus]UOR05601.1 DsbA family protein [Hymenobacter aerilatus]